MASSEPKSTDYLVQLGQIITKSISDLEQLCDKNAVPFPHPNDTFTPQSEAFRTIAGAAEAANIIAAAAYQLVAAVMPPPTALYGLMMSGNYKTACLRVCVEANVVEILREAGPEGLHINELAAKCNLPYKKLARILRFLATHHVFREITPAVFTNTRLSSTIDSGKSTEELFAHPADKHDNTSGLPALMGHHLDEVSKGCTMLWETLSDPLTAHSDESNETPFNRALDTNLTLWEFYESPGQEHRLKRFGAGMRGVEALQPPEAILEAFDWKSLPEDAVVVDVAGGVGTSSLPLAEHHGHLQLVLQDRPPVIEEAQSLWKSKLPYTLESGRVKLQAHDFFTEQPVKNASVFILKQILHDWSDPYAIKILKLLREAAQPDTKLILIDSIIQYACPFPTTDEESKIPGVIPREAEPPLLANYGIANTMGYLGDLTMMVLFNAQERTIKHISDLLKRTGWKLTKVRRTDGANGFLQPVEAVPV